MEGKLDYYDLEDYANFGLRLLAYLIDGIILSVVVWILMMVFMGSAFAALGGLGGMENMSEEEAMMMMGPMMAAIGGVTLGAIVVQWLYFALMESSANQATLGKMALGIKVTDMNGDRLTFLRATGRHFSKIISGMILMIGYIMAAFTEKRQALHDMIAGTLVLNKDVPPLD